jgi:8-oxo-dGTP pyrophosphatase MutT (NUDIX family)
VTLPTRIVEVAELDFAYEPAPWRFAEAETGAIAAHWARLRKKKPAIYNGRILLLHRRELIRRADGELKLQGSFFETGYADFVAWRAFGHPGEPVENCFAMAALQGADGAFLLGEMAPHTYSAGQIYFPAGTPDLSDVFDGAVDLGASARRELLEETGVDAAETAVRRGWSVIFSPSRIACVKLMTLAVSAEEARARIDAFLACDPHAEFTHIHVVRGLDDIDERRMPAFVAAYLRAAFAWKSAYDGTT